jgi:hypothetical protein
MMRAAFAGAEVEPDTAIVAQARNDPKDRHVLAGAVASNAGLIVTLNLRHFPTWALAPYDLSAQSPDSFLLALTDVASARIGRILRELAADYDRPPRTVTEVLERLGRHAPGFAAEWLARLGAQG